MVKNAKNDDEVQSVLKPLTPDLRLSWDSYFAPERLREELMHIAETMDPVFQQKLQAAEYQEVLSRMWISCKRNCKQRGV
eukprot:g18506.t1